MLDLNDFFFFVQVVDRGGFTAAGRALRVPKSTLSHRLQELEQNLGVRLLNRTSRRFGMTEAGSEFYRHSVAMLREADRAEGAVRRRVREPTGTVRCTASLATMQFAVSEVLSSFLVQYPKVNVVAHATNELVDLVGERYDVAVRAHTAPLPDSTLVQQMLAPAPWFLFAGSAYFEAHRMPETPRDLPQHPSLFMMRSGCPPIWRLRESRERSREIEVPLTPRLVSDGSRTPSSRAPRTNRRTAPSRARAAGDAPCRAPRRSRGTIAGDERGEYCHRHARRTRRSCSGRSCRERGFTVSGF